MFPFPAIKPIVDDLSEYTLVPYAPEHRDSLIEMVRDRFRDVGMDLDLADVHRDLAQIDECWREPGGAFVVLLHHDTVVGSLCIRPISDRPFAAEADWFFFRREYEGKGLSLLLFRWCADWCRAHSIQWIELWTNSERWWAHKIYKKLGFVHNGVKRHYADTTPPCDRLYFELAITPETYRRLDRIFQSF